MNDLKWLINRLKAMKPKELVWRVGQKRLQNKEYGCMYRLNLPVTEIPLSIKLLGLHINIRKLSINWDNKCSEPFEALDLFGVFPYEKYKNKWNAGFQTGNTWSEDGFSPSISISQKVEIGDIRTNWELNRHYQFAALAKSYYCTRDDYYLIELKALFSDWNKRNLFLHGVEWISAMELAIRVNSWVYMLAFLQMAGVEGKLIEDIEHGIFVMTSYIVKHRAKYSSANNHLIVEMYAVVLVGILTDYKQWTNMGIRILSDELPRQNYSDGVNKEMSLHYQSFVIEAYGLLWLLMIKNGIEIPNIWKEYLTNMTEFIADSTDDYGMTMEFGDSDEGKILDLVGNIDNHYQYILNLMSCLLDKKYTDSEWHENLKWIVPDKLKNVKKKYIPKLICSRREGGYTFFRSKDRKILIGIDHADLGFDSIAAHGHEDALSFQMFIEGKPIFVDSGTYNYHFTPKDRDWFRSTEAHNTIMINGCEQSEMLGPFIWGKKSRSKIEDIEIYESKTKLTVSCESQVGVHKRIFEYDGRRILYIRDAVEGNARAYFHISPQVNYEMKGKSVKLGCGNCIVMVSNTMDEVEISNAFYSDKYNRRQKTVTFSVDFIGNLETVIRID